MVKQPPLKTTNSFALGHSQSLGHIPNLARRIIFLFSRLAYLEAPSTNTECWVNSSEGGAFFWMLAGVHDRKEVIRKDDL